jgi:23S rRNA (cytidine1920-2'-O)/16S rRNA (cytidine1409-2'-O)-methyltransferase
MASPLPDEAPRRRADVALVERGFYASRARAQEAIAAGLVTADGRPVRKPSDLISAGAAIEAGQPHPYVSRGGVKLAAALDAFRLDPRGWVCLDVGASTGGFTEVLLQRGAAKVYAVDVGRDQLHPSLRADPRVVSLESTDARALTPDLIPEPADALVSDVSFISLKLVLPAAVRLLKPKAILAVLVKPQFEAGPAHVRKGIVRDEAVHRAVCEDIAAFVRSLGFEVVGVVPSPIEGGDGNREFLLGARRG